MVRGVQLPAYLHISQISVVTFLDHERSQNFTGYVMQEWKIEVVGSISTNCWLPLSRKFMKIAFESLRNKFQ